MRVTYYTEIFSSWCLWAEPAWAELKARFAGRVIFDWRIALMNAADNPKALDEVIDKMRIELDIAIKAPTMFKEYLLGTGPAPTGRSCRP